MADLERNVAGITCREVLGRLSDYLDGDLTAEETARIEAHVQGCDWCERFGGRFGAVVATVKRGLGEPDQVPADVQARLAARLAQELSSGSN